MFYCDISFILGCCTMFFFFDPWVLIGIILFVVIGAIGMVMENAASILLVLLLILVIAFVVFILKNY